MLNAVKRITLFAIFFTFCMFVGQIEFGSRTIADHTKVIVQKINSTRQVQEAKAKIPATIKDVRRKIAKWINPDQRVQVPGAKLSP